MASKFKLNILTPDKNFYSGDIIELSTVTVNGSIGILADHSPFVGLLQPAITKIKLEDGSVKTAFTSTGILKVEKTGVEMIVDASEWPDDIDVNRAEEAKERAEKRITDAKASEKVDINRAEVSLQRALIRLRVKGK